MISSIRIMPTKFAQIILMVATMPLSIEAAPLERMLAFYEIKAEVQGNSSVARTSKPVEFGTPISHEFGEYQLSMLFSPAETDNFTLEASLNSIVPSTKAIVYTMLSESFTGQISSPGKFSQSEFTLNENGVSISIVIRLSLIE